MHAGRNKCKKKESYKVGEEVVDLLRLRFLTGNSRDPPLLLSTYISSTEERNKCRASRSIYSSVMKHSSGMKSPSGSMKSTGKKP